MRKLRDGSGDRTNQPNRARKVEKDCTYSNVENYSTQRICFPMHDKARVFIKAGDYGKKRILFLSENTTNDKTFIDLDLITNLPMQHTQTRTISKNTLTCLIQENNNIIYSGKAGPKRHKK